ncbi:ABC transporter ATP-binding protein [Nakamurella lactea]|uniref:ABC transporter ATP-binding protein n=1 Tax=Nakamurella lactea TaxID=459515 RepID=UPI000418930D|nr:ABC transporter ATP-binding protein [Nakamurella lactea]
MEGEAAALLRVRGLTATFEGHGHRVPALRGIDFEVGRAESVGFVGESGSGKSVTARSVLGLEPEGSTIERTGSVLFNGRELLGLSDKQMQDIRGRQVGMVFQDPMTSLNPVLTIGDQIDDMLRRHRGWSRRAARSRTVELLDLVGIREPAQRANDHPHQFSGGMRQRVLIAVAVSCEPELLIADEPTTALDVTVQAQILRLLIRLREELGMSLMLITHDFGVIAGMVDRVYVMYRGEVVESGSVDAIMHSPREDYTKALIQAVPRIELPEGT